MRQAKTLRCSDSDKLHDLKDYCGVCLPYWDKFPVCPDCGWKLHQGRLGKIFTCLKCHKRFTWDDHSCRNYPALDEQGKVINLEGE
jgi:predicted RNA-binding Zn-ribbon protein involved in translation (DUF1610 family)